MTLAALPLATIGALPISSAPIDINEARTDLDAYVARADDSYTYQIVDRHELDAVEAIVVRLISQTWHGRPWQHWLSLLVPKEIAYPHGATLVIAGGTNGATDPDLHSKQVVKFAAVAAQNRTMVAICQQIPNQPLLNGLSEDALIAETFRHYLDAATAPRTTYKESGNDWPLLLPMVKSAMRAMDAVQTIGQNQLNMQIDRFVVTGASKRGWTTWLTAAVDARVCAIAPMVIDMLNFGPQLQQHKRHYGGTSNWIGDYEQRGIFDRLHTDRGRRLCAIVDPFAYRHRLTMPKLILLGTNDPYWTVDSANRYFHDLPPKKYLFYLPNTDHDLGQGILPTINAFIRASLGDQPLAPLQWSRHNGKLTVSWGDRHGVASLWIARSASRDFRQSQWQDQLLDGAGQVTVDLAPPNHGWLASFLHVQFGTYGLSTPITVLPEP